MKYNLIQFNELLEKRLTEKEINEKFLNFISPFVNIFANLSNIAFNLNFIYLSYFLTNFFGVFLILGLNLLRTPHYHLNLIIQYYYLFLKCYIVINIQMVKFNHIY